jgi:hypothetical protein
MNEPNPNNWIVAASGKTLFVLSDLITHELEYIRRKSHTPKNEDSNKKADYAVKSLADLFRQGAIADGIPIQAGWVIGVPSPRQAELEDKLNELEDIVKAFGHSDTKLLLLTKECGELFKSVPTVFVTGEVNLSNVAQMNGVPCHLWRRFPIDDLREYTSTTSALDWERVLGDIQEETKQSAIAVEATLASLKEAPHWVFVVDSADQVNMAEGYGVIRDSTGDKAFLWAVLFNEMGFLWSSFPLAEVPFGEAVSLDFMGKDVDPRVRRSVASRISDCANVRFGDETLTFQSAQSVMEMFLLSEFPEMSQYGEGEGGPQMDDDTRLASESLQVEYERFKRQIENLNGFRGCCRPSHRLLMLANSPHTGHGCSSLWITAGGSVRPISSASSHKRTQSMKMINHRGDPRHGRPAA